VWISRGTILYEGADPSAANRAIVEWLTLKIGAAVLTRPLRAAALTQPLGRRFAILRQIFVLIRQARGCYIAVTTLTTRRCYTQPSLTGILSKGGSS
jgi:hypothetical protein